MKLLSSHVRFIIRQVSSQIIFCSYFILENICLLKFDVQNIKKYFYANDLTLVKSSLSQNY